jgi:hypothetical protein
MGGAPEALLWGIDRPRHTPALVEQRVRANVVERILWREPPNDRPPPEALRLRKRRRGATLIGASYWDAFVAEWQADKSALSSYAPTTSRVTYSQIAALVTLDDPSPTLPRKSECPAFAGSNLP